MAFGDSRALKFIYEGASGLERGLQSRRQKKAFIYDTFGALLEMLGKAPVSTRAQFSRSQFEFYWAPFWTAFGEPKSFTGAIVDAQGLPEHLKTGVSYLRLFHGGQGEGKRGDL